VREGYAQVSTFPPDVKYQQRFLEAQRQEREANRGLWGACQAWLPTVSTRPVGQATTMPAQAGGCPQGCTTPPKGCVIKGNISSSGERIFHLPGGGSYNATVISPSAGERWFCTVQEALNNGWRKARN